MPEKTTTATIDIAKATAGDVPAIIEAARLGVEPVELELGSIYATVQADGTVRVIDLATEDHRKRQGQSPIRKTGHAHLTDHKSFTTYVGHHGEQLATELWADRDRGTIVAVLNGHLIETDGAGWGDHRATLTLTQTKAWKAWTSVSGRMMGQVEFAEFLEDHLIDVVDPTGAHLLEIAQSIEATKGVVMKSATRLDNGEVKVRYEEQVDAKAGQQGDLTIPSRIVLGIAPFEGLDPYRVEARLRYRLGNGQLSLAVLIDRPEDVLRSAFTAVTDEVAADLDLPILFGSPVA